MTKQEKYQRQVNLSDANMGCLKCWNCRDNMDGSCGHVDHWQENQYSDYQPCGGKKFRESKTN